MDKGSVARVIALVIALLNAALNLVGFQTIPTEFSNELAGIIVTLVALWTAWKNNYLSSKGKKQKEVLEKNKLV